MDRRYRRPLTRSVFLAVVLGGHVLLVLLLTSSKPGDGRSGKANPEEFRSILVLLDLKRPEPVELPPDEQKPEPTPGASNSRNKSRTAARSAAPEPASAPSGVEDISGTAIDAPQIDWQGEAQRTAQAMAPGLLKKQQRECEEAKRLGKYPPGCKKPASAYNKHFEPEPKRVGMQGLIPYVRIGKRCVVALGAFGCALGKLPEADGTVFDDMRDPDRPRSSVPDIEDPTGFGTAKMPLPEAVVEAEQ
jgi:hypothetical protein